RSRFFFSSRRRHTRSYGDWSSDVCSSDLPLPILMSRTPYGIGQSDSDGINRRYNELVKDGYIFVLQDIRGRFGSEGQFLMNRPRSEERRVGKEGRARCSPLL